MIANNDSHIRDEMVAQLIGPDGKIKQIIPAQQGQELEDPILMMGEIIAEVYGPDGNLKQREVTHNLVTTNGDNYCANKVFGGGATSMAGMKLGTATTAATKTGAGSFLAVADYIAASAVGLDATFPKQGAAANVSQYQTTWAAGIATNATINRVGIVDNTTNAGEADATHTLSMGVFASPINKGAGDSLVVIWNITFLGA